MKPGGPLRRSGFMERSGSLKRTRINPINRERREKLRAAQFGKQAELCRRSRCCVPGCQSSDESCDPHHVPSRAAGGLDQDTVPLCRFHHDEFHSCGERTFDERHEVVLPEVTKEFRKLSEAIE